MCWGRSFREAGAPLQAPVYEVSACSPALAQEQRSCQDFTFVSEGGVAGKSRSGAEVVGVVVAAVQGRSRAQSS